MSNNSDTNSWFQPENFRFKTSTLQQTANPNTNQFTYNHLKNIAKKNFKNQNLSYQNHIHPTTNIKPSLKQQSYSRFSYNNNDDITLVSPKSKVEQFDPFYKSGYNQYKIQKAIQIGLQSKVLLRLASEDKQNRNMRTLKENGVESIKKLGLLKKQSIEENLINNFDQYKFKQFDKKLFNKTQINLEKALVHKRSLNNFLATSDHNNEFTQSKSYVVYSRSISNHSRFISPTQEAQFFYKTNHKEGRNSVNTKQQSRSKYNASFQGFLQKNQYEDNKIFKKKNNEDNNWHNKRIYQQTSIPNYSHKSNFIKPELKLEDFHIITQLGKGMYGKVYLVQHKILRFICAMKIISKKMIKQEKIQDQISRQIKIHSLTNHPNIVKLYGYFSDKQNLYMLLQYCQDGQLYQIMKLCKVFSEQKIKYIIKQIASAVQYLHINHILHRDIKPENIIVTHNVIKICDFGWSVHFKKSELRETRCGTPLYLSPEMIKGEHYDQSADIWTIGILTYQLLMGDTPFKIKNQYELHKIVNQKVIFSSKLKASNCIKDFILRILQKNPERRLEMKQILQHDFIKYIDVNTSDIELKF